MSAPVLPTKLYADSPEPQALTAHSRALAAEPRAKVVEATVVPAKSGGC